MSDGRELIYRYPVTGLGFDECIAVHEVERNIGTYRGEEFDDPVFFLRVGGAVHREDSEPLVQLQAAFDALAQVVLTRSRACVWSFNFDLQLYSKSEELNQPLPQF